MYVQAGLKRRNVNVTGMNKNSSRSHAVLQILVEQRWVSSEPKDGNRPQQHLASPTPSNADQNSSNLTQPNAGTDTSTEGPSVKTRHFRKALLTVVDLAGSERLSKTGSEGMRLEEAKTINKSIAALANVIQMLASQKSMNYVPFRDSKLTRLLSESLGGNCKTTICACVSPSMLHYDESYSTLLFAIKAMSVRTRVMMNERIEVKRDDDARSAGGMSGLTSRMQSQNELAL